MRVVHVITVPFSLRLMRGQLAFMRAQGVDVQVICSDGPELEAFSRAEGIPVHPVEMVREIAPGRDLTSVAALTRVLRRLAPDVAHAHFPKAGLLGMLAATAARVPVRLYHLRGLRYATAEGRRRALLMGTERVACTLAHRVVAVSESLRLQAADDGVCPADKMGVVHHGSSNGVDADGRFNPARLPAETRARVREAHGVPAEATVIGFVGRLVRDKGLVELAEAWSRLREAHPEARLMLVGPWEPFDPVPEAVRRRLETDPRVHLTGALDNPAAAYAAFDLVALPTWREGFANVILEAGAMGLPIVATRVTGCVDGVQDGVTGLLVPVREPAALAAALGRYLADPALRASHGRAGREQATRDFRPQDVWRGLLGVYEELCRERGVATGLRVAA